MKILIIISFFISINGFDLTTRSEKKLDKTLLNHFKGKSISKYEIDFSSDRIMDIWDEDLLLYRLISDSDTLGFVTVSRTKGRYDHFDFMIIYSSKLEVDLVQLLVYRSEHGGEISGEKWLRQFVSSSSIKELSFGKDVEAISGATLSGVSITNAINSLNKVVARLRFEKLL